MNRKREMVLKAFLAQCSQEKREALVRFLPEKERDYLAALPDSSVPFEEAHEQSLLDKVHWSWFLPTLKTYPEKEQKLFLAALPSRAAKQLEGLLSLEAVEEDLTKVGRTFLKRQLLQTICPQDQILPMEFLPASPLNQLLALDKKNLIRLIDFLALYDLTDALLQIVETKILKTIYSFLSEEQKRILKQISHHKETGPWPKLGLEKWEGTEEAFRMLLHRRGLMRLGLALSGQDSDLVWTICHRLDIGRGSTLFKLCGKEKAGAFSDIAIRQIEELLGLIA